MISRGGESSIEDNRYDTLSNPSATQLHTGAVISADELSMASGVINWIRMADLQEFEAMVDHVIIVGYYGMAGLMGA